MDGYSVTRRVTVFPVVVFTAVTLDPMPTTSFRLFVESSGMNYNIQRKYLSSEATLMK